MKLASSVLPSSLRADQTEIGELLDAFSRQAASVYFVQIGSADGVHGDPIRRFVLRDGWSGILVEPVGHLFARLIQNYEGRPGLIFENVAVSDHEETRDFWYLRETDEDLPKWYEQLGSFDRDVIVRHADKLKDIERYLVRESVRCTTLAVLLRKHHVLRIDVLVIDTEGYDYEIVKQVDFDSYPPSILLYEHKHLSNRNQASCKRYLRSRGYALSPEAGNTVAYRRGAVAGW